MKKSILTLLIALTSILWINAQVETFTLRSSELGGQATKTQEFNGFGCDGANFSPQLMWENAPEGTKSFAVTMYDPDAPTGGGFWHWLVFDIPSDKDELLAGAGGTNGEMLPEGAIQSSTSFGGKGYGGPCPPEGHGIHKYEITVYALKTEKLGLDANATPALVGYYLWQNTIEKASIVMYYER